MRSAISSIEQSSGNSRTVFSTISFSVMRKLCCYDLPKQAAPEAAKCSAGFERWDVHAAKARHASDTLQPASPPDVRKVSDLPEWASMNSGLCPCAEA